MLPVAALFGVVRSSGVVGVDEKWVQVPSNDKPAGKHHKWMYVYVAIDVSSYDLLHIAIFPYVGSGGKCRLELAGYDVSKLPMAQICRGQMMDWPSEALAEVVPRE